MLYKNRLLKVKKLGCESNNNECCWRGLRPERFENESRNTLLTFKYLNLVSCKHNNKYEYFNNQLRYFVHGSNGVRIVWFEALFVFNNTHKTRLVYKYMPYVILYYNRKILYYILQFSLTDDNSLGNKGTRVICVINKIIIYFFSSRTNSKSYSIFLYKWKITGGYSLRIIIYGHSLW